jgi:hypothetical protein
LTLTEEHKNITGVGGLSRPCSLTCSASDFSRVAANFLFHLSPVIRGFDEVVSEEFNYPLMETDICLKTKNRRIMNLEDRQKVLLNIDYNKLLSYLAGVFVFFFLLLHLSTERDVLPWYFVFSVSSASLMGALFFILASYHNYKEIIRLENELKLSEIMESSGTFSRRKSKDPCEREVSYILKFLVWGVVITSIFMFLFNIKVIN